MDINNKKLVDDPFLLASWIAKSMAGELSDEELQLLDEWRMTSARNHQLYDRIVSRERREAKRRHFTAFDKVSGWQGYSKKLKETEKKVNRWRVFLRYAAILLIPLSATVYGVLRSGEETVSLADLNAITPGGTRAELVLPSGEVVDLVAKSGVISRGENTVINNEGKTLSYKSIGNQAPMDSLRYNEVIVPKGGEYQLVLSDGTLVYLNSMTKIRFPERFSEKCREVEVCGEAFFEVAENKRVPFVVKTDAYEITVLGTKFNVTAYADEQVATTTLVEGAVSISGKCIVFNRIDNNGKTISDRNDMYRNEQVCKKLKAKHGLYFAGGKEQVKQHRLKEPDKSKYEIYTAVKNEIGKSRNWQQLQERLAEKGITVRFKRKGQTDEIQGISFSKGEYTFKGSEIDRSFSFSKLDKCFGYAGMNVAGSQRQTTFAPVREQALAPGKADSPLITGSLGLFSASSPPVDEEPNFNLRKKKKKKKQLKL